jgi:aminoglycoside phosphotransferase family enzyme/predicted kinase
MDLGSGPEGRVVETHVSVLIFHEDTVVKFKKALELPFVDLSSGESRLRACEAEVELNRRLSPDVYLGVADLDLDGVVFDHAVVMRRLPAERNFAVLAARGDESVGRHMKRLARVLADFHARSDRSEAISSCATAESVRDLWRGCFDALEPYIGIFVDPEMLSLVERLAYRYLEGRTELFAERIARGHVCDGHGDLLASDVFLLDDGPRILDCIEFDPRLRHVDVLADIAFLLMDLERLGAKDVGGELLSLYLEASGEAQPATLLHHYIAERATVRAEVACTRAAQVDPTSAQDEMDEARMLLELATGHLLAGRVVLAVVSGLPGTGKSTVAAAIGDRLEWPVLRSDEVRREIVGARGAGALVEEFGTGAYGHDITDRTYAAVIERARTALHLGQPVLIDATFVDGRHRAEVERLARETSSDLVVIECVAPPDVVGARLRERRAHVNDISGADEDVAAAMAAKAHRWKGASLLDTAETTPAAVVEKALAMLSRQDEPTPSRARPGPVHGGPAGVRADP